ncbi:MAG: QueT transporter family protein [Oscillospiraceae bacterium]|nr:QueT transporter family protein [Oscillospiraceae bacterium]
MKNLSARKMAFAAVVAAVYAALTMSLGFMSYGNIQFRIAEALSILPFFFPVTTWGLFLGCLIANLMSPVGVADVVFGSLATLMSCLCIQALGSKTRDTTEPFLRSDAQQNAQTHSWLRCILACLMPVVWNALIIGAMLAVMTSAGGIETAMPLFGIYALEVGAGEFAVMFIIGLPLMRIFPKKKYFRHLEEKLK